MGRFGDRVRGAEVLIGTIQGCRKAVVRLNPICNHHAERVRASPGSEDPGGMKAAVAAICKAPAQQGNV